MTRSISSARLAVRSMGTSLKFAAAGDRVVTSAPVSTATNSVTMGAWVKRNNHNNTTEQMFFFNGNGDSNGIGLSINGNTSAGSDLYILRGGLAWHSAGYLIQDDNWHHLTITISSANLLTLYVDGTSVFTRASSTFNTPTTSTNVSTDRGIADRTFYGQVDEFFLYDSVLTASEVANIINGAYPAGAKLRWLFDEGSGTSALDATGNGKTGTITGATYSTNVPVTARTAASTRLVATSRLTV